MNKIIIILLVSAGWLGCKNEGTNKPSTPDLTSEMSSTFDWLIGSWERSNSQQGVETYELWNKVNNTFYKGIGVTLEGGDSTTSMESMDLVFEDDSWRVKVMSLGDSIGVVFNIETFTDKEFTAINMENDFPTHIHYKAIKDEIIATIWTGKDSILFEFVPRDQ